MGTTARFKQIMKDKKLHAQDVADATGTSLQNIYNTFHRDNVSFATAENIAEALGCEILFVDKESGRIY